jgi:hypothetical protein
MSWKREIPRKGEIPRKCSFRPWILAIIILCAVVWRASADALAQDAAPTGLRITTDSTWWSSERLGLNKAPYLVIGMADRSDNLAYGWRRLASDEVMYPSTGSTIMRHVGSATSASRSEKIEYGPLVLSSLLQPSAGVRGLADFRTGRRQTIPRSPDPAGAKIYTLLDDGSAPGSFLYGYHTNYLPSEQWLANNESFTHEVVPAPSPLFEFEFAGWRLPVMLSGAAVSR